MPNEANLLRHLPEIVYSLLFIGSMFLPLRWAIAAFLVLSTVDIESSGQGLGPMNLSKGLILPAYMLWRMRSYARRDRAGLPLGAAAWCGLTLYVAIAALWSVFPLASLKLVGHMAGMLLIAALLTTAAKCGFLESRIVMPVSFAVLLLALLRSRFIPAYADEPERFTSFTTAQSAAALIAALYCLTLFAADLRPGLRALTGTALASMLVFNGSRVWFIAILLASAFSVALAKVASWAKICAIGVAVLAACLLTLEFDSMMLLLRKEAPFNRIASTVTALYEGDSSSTGLGTVNFRRKIDALAVDRIEHSSLHEWIFGHGTCNGAMITGSLFHGYAKYSDPNRMFHNEWLRAFYEWGLIGFALGLVCVQQMVAFAWRSSSASEEGFGKPLLIYLPGFLLALGVENLIAGAGNAASMGFLLLLAYASTAGRQSDLRIQDEPEDEYEQLLEGEAAAGY